MKINVTQEKLARALGNVSRVAAGSRAALSVLNNVLIKVDEGRVSLTTTNLDMAMVDYLPVTETENGIVTVPARLLAEFVSNLPHGANVEIRSDEPDKLEIKAGQYSSVINGAAADDFPELPEIDEKKAVIFKMGVDEFKTGVSQVALAASNDTTRPILTGVCVSTVDSSLFVAATDGYRMAERRLIDKVESELKAILPVATIQEVLRSISDEAEEVEILFDNTQVKFRLGEIEIISKMIDGSYPDYRKIMPQSAELVLTVDKVEMMRVAKLAALFARESGGSIMMHANEEKQVLEVYAVANELGENVSEMKMEIDKDVKVIVNAKYLIDALNCMEESRILMGISGERDPVIFKNEVNNNYTHVLMPQRGK